MNSTGEINKKEEYIVPGDFESIPEFYESLTDNPVKELFTGKKSIAGDVIITRKLDVYTVTIPAKSGATYGTIDLVGTHDCEGSVPICQVYLLSSGANGANFNTFIPAFQYGSSSNGYMDLSTYTVHVYNTTASSYVATYGVLVQEIKIK